MISSFRMALMLFTFLMYPMSGISGAEPVMEHEVVLPRNVHKSMVEVAGEAKVRHATIGQFHGTTIYTARFIDPGNGIEQIFTVASDGHIMYVEPFLFTAVSSKRKRPSILW